MKYIRARVHEKQWGGSIMPYIRQFENQEDIIKFINKTGFKVEILGEIELPSKDETIENFIKKGEEEKARLILRNENFREEEIHSYIASIKADLRRL